MGDQSEASSPGDFRPSDPGLRRELSQIPGPTVSPLDDLTLRAEVRCVLSLSNELLSYGLPVHRVEESVTRMAHSFGLRATVMGLPTCLSITLHDERGSVAYLVRAEPGAVHLGRLDALHALVGRLERHRVSADDALEAIKAIVRHPRTLAAPLELACAALVGAGGVQLLGGNLVDSLLAALLGMATGALSRLFAPRPMLARTTPVLAASGVTLASAALAHAKLAPHPLIVTMASLLVLLPGLTLTLATVELATGHLVCGTARLVGASTTFMQLGFGTLVGVRLGALAAVQPVERELVPLELEALGALALALGFAGLVSVRRADAMHTAFICAFAWGASRALAPVWGTELAVLFAATGTALLSNAFARRYDRPSSVLLVPGIVMLVPGSMGMLSISSALLHDPARALATTVEMLILIMALSTGVLVAAAVLPPRTEPQRVS